MTEKFEMVKIHQADILNDLSLEIIKGGIKDPNPPCNPNECTGNSGLCAANYCSSNTGDCGTNNCNSNLIAGGNGECNSEYTD